VACIYEYRKHPKLYTEYAYDACMDTHCASSSWPQLSQQNTGVLSRDAGATALQTVHKVFTYLLKPLSDARCQTGYEMIWADKNVRLCFPKLFCWLADHRANATIHAIASNHCPVCIVLVEKRGKYSETGYPRRSHADYITTYRESDALSLNEQGVKNINNALWSLIELNPLDLVRADILYNILLGVWTHMIDWIQDFLEHYERINVFDYVWRRLPPYPGFCVLTKSYRVVSQ